MTKWMNSKIAGLSASLVRPEQLRRQIARIVAVTILLTIAYWGLIASDRYVSEAHVIIQKTDLASGQSMDIGSFLAGSSGNNRADQLLLRDHLLSLDMMNKLDAQLDLRTHFSGWGHDPVSALWFRNTSQERMHQYFQNRLSVEFDDYAGVLIIKAQAYDAKTAHAIGTMLVEEGERAMNELAHRLAGHADLAAFGREVVTLLRERFGCRRIALWLRRGGNSKLETGNSKLETRPLTPET